ncbi:MAG: glycosyltransferase [Actinoplanes sp.]
MPRVALDSDGPVWCGQLDRLAPTPLRVGTSPDGRPYRRARLLVLDGRQPVSFVEVPVSDGAVDVDLALARTGDTRSGAVVPADRTAAEVSVVVCTRNRPAELKACLDGLLGLDPAPLEIIVVDNAPSDDRTRLAVESVAAVAGHVRYVLERRPGLSRARNAGVAAAAGRIVAFTDDDVRVDPHWIDGLLRGFARRSDVVCVTGLVATDRLDHVAEQYFDARVSWSSSCTPRLFDLASAAAPLFPYAAGRFGTGANVAFLAAFLHEVGGFDETLGAGSLTRGGEDLDAFVKVLRTERALAYEPAALVWHRHRDDFDALRGQMFGYGTGLTGYLTKYLLQPSTAVDILRQVPYGLAHMSRQLGRPAVAARRSPPWRLRAAEIAGLLYGPIAYLRSRRVVRRQQRRMA